MGGASKCNPVEFLIMVANTMVNQYERLEGANGKAPDCHKGHGGLWSSSD